MRQKNKLISTLMIAGIVISSCAIAQNITGSGTNNYVLKFTSTGSTAGNSSIFDNGNVGIGTVAPTSSKLQLVATGSGYTQEKTSGGYFFSTGFSGNDPYLTYYAGSGMTLGYGTNTGAAPTISALRLLTNGNIGIGTTTPGAKLEVAGQVKITGGTPGAGKILVSDANGLASWSTVGANGGWSITGNAGTVDGTNFVGTTDDIPFNIRVNNQKAGRIDRALFNTFFGYQTGNSNTTGGANTFMGYHAGNANTTGFGNTATGHRALYSNTEGYNNNAFGYQALFSNTTGDENVATGYQALFSNTDGFGNSAFGNEALSSNTIGTRNTATGILALRYNTEGSRNTACGYATLYTITTGSYNTALGHQADVDNVARTNSITLAGNGNLALGGDNRVRVGNSSMSSIGGQVGWTTISDARVKENVSDNVKGLEFIMKLNPVTYNYSIAKSNSVQGKESNEDWTGKYDIEKMRFSGFLSQEVEKAAKESDYDFSGVDKPQDERGLWGLRYAEFTIPLVKAVQEQQTMIDSLKTTTASLKDYMNQQDSVISALKKQMDQFALSNNNAMQSLSSLNLTDVELSNKNVVVLNQNVPNPFSEQTTINYYLPDNVSRAQIIFFDQSGKIIKAVDLKEKGKGALNIFANDLSSGIYTYSLIVDGQTLETKKMVKAK